MSKRKLVASRLSGEALVALTGGAESVWRRNTPTGTQSQGRYTYLLEAMEGFTCVASNIHTWVKENAKIRSSQVSVLTSTIIL